MIILSVSVAVVLVILVGLFIRGIMFITIHSFGERHSFDEILILKSPVIIIRLFLVYLISSLNDSRKLSTGELEFDTQTWLMIKTFDTYISTPPPLLRMKLYTHSPTLFFHALFIVKLAA